MTMPRRRCASCSSSTSARRVLVRAPEKPRGASLPRGCSQPPAARAPSHSAGSARRRATSPAQEPLIHGPQRGGSSALASILQSAMFRLRRQSRDAPGNSGQTGAATAPGEQSYDEASGGEQDVAVPVPPALHMKNRARQSSAPLHHSSTAPTKEPQYVSMDDADAPQQGTPDIIARAFHEALAPYAERAARLETQLAQAHSTIQTLEAEKAAVHNWIDRRGLRPDLPPDLASYFAASPVAAGTLAAQLERKMTMLNYSLHALGDVLPAPPPASTVTSALAALLPSIQQLAGLPGGAAGAFEALIKLAGNLNSHGTGDETDADRAAIASFYSDLDDTMLRVVAARSTAAAEGQEDWDLSRDLERLQRTGAFLKKEMGVRNYFVRSQEAMRNEGRHSAARLHQPPGGGVRVNNALGSNAPLAGPGGGDLPERYGGEGGR